MERVLLTSLLEAGEEHGQRADSSWKKPASEKAKRDVQSVAGRPVVTQQAIKNKIDVWKKMEDLRASHLTVWIWCRRAWLRNW